MKIFGFNIISDSKLASIKAAAVASAGDVVRAAVAQLQDSDVGKAVAADITAVSSEQLSGAEKFEAVLTNTLPLIVQWAAKGGVSAAIAEVEDLGRALVQTVYNTVKSSTAPSLAAKILAILGIK